MGLIIPMGQWILRNACTSFKAMIDCYHFSDVTLSVNISAIQFDDPDFVGMLKRTLQESGLSPQNLELEITESVLIKSLDQTICILHELKELGVKIALDDFGTGYSSLRYLQLLPIDTLKIDKSFVDNIDPLAKNKQVIGAIISLVHQMNIFVVAEGVENEMQLSFLQKEACDGIQGYLLGKPQTLPELTRDLNRRLGILEV
jgi:EAL domain-containing protein (putative c-di-GMP-specific phosphodiesterase class I)